MDNDFLRRVLITGADKGLGLSLTARFLHAGWQTFAGIYQDAHNLKAMEQEYGPRLVCVPLDVTDMPSVLEACHQVSAYTQALDILVNNAAINLHPKPVRTLAELNLTDGHLEATFDVNSLGPLRVTQQFLPLLKNGSKN